LLQPFTYADWCSCRCCHRGPRRRTRSASRRTRATRRRQTTLPAPRPPTTFLAQAPLSFPSFRRLSLLPRRSLTTPAACRVRCRRRARGRTRGRESPRKSTPSSEERVRSDPLPRRSTTLTCPSRAPARPSTSRTLQCAQRGGDPPQPRQREQGRVRQPL